MRLWTVHPSAVWNQIRTGGFALVDPFRAHPRGWTHPQYDWLTWRLRDRIVDSHGFRPWFAYCERPDLRWVRHARPLGSREVLIEFEAPAGAFVDFPCWAWHDVFCRNYLARSRGEFLNFDQSLKLATGRSLQDHDQPLPEPWQDRLESSWRRLFDPEIPARSWRRGAVDRRLEAVVEILRREWVVRVKEFVGADASHVRSAPAAIAETPEIG